MENHAEGAVESPDFVVIVDHIKCRSCPLKTWRCKGSMFLLSMLPTEQRVFPNAVPRISSLERKGLAQGDKRSQEEDRLPRPGEQVDFAQGAPCSCSVLLEQKGFRFDWRVRETIAFWGAASICHEGRHRFEDIGAVDEKGWNDL